MMRHSPRQLAIALLAFCPLSACLLGPSKPRPVLEITTQGADSGPRPDGDVVLRAFQAWKEETLRDPASAMYRLAGIEPGRVVNHSPELSGWIATLHCNAKNGFGGYAGWKQERWLVKDGTLVAIELVPDERYGRLVACAVMDTPIAISALVPRASLSAAPK